MFYIQNLPDKDLLGKSDPYAKVYLVGGGTQFVADGKHLKTKTHKNNLNPEFNEIFKFKVVLYMRVFLLLCPFERKKNLKIQREFNSCCTRYGLLYF